MYRQSRDMARVLQYASMPVVNERTCSYYMRVSALKNVLKFKKTVKEMSFS